MCGRYVIARAAGDLVDELDAWEPEEEILLRPNYNVAPTTDVPIVLERLVEAGTPGAVQTPGGLVRRELHVARWGLLPIWAKDASFSSRAFNARSETVLEKPSFRSAVKSKRCVVPVDGYYEWRSPAGGKGTKTPFFVHREDGKPIVFAGLYEWWKDPAVADGEEGQWVLSCTILTTASPSPEDDGVQGALGALHDRLPIALVDEDAIAAWLDPSNKDAASLVEAVGARAVEATQGWALREVGSAVGNVRNNGPELIEPVGSLF